MQVSTQYLDGFAQGMQTVVHNFTPGKSLVSPADSRFRVTPVGYLPYSAAGFGFRAGAFTEQQNYYNNLYPGEGSTAYSYTENTSTASKRTETSYAPGKSQVGQLRGTEKQRITNSAGEVRRWSLDANGLPVSSGYYSAGRLFGELTRIPGETSNSIVPYSKTFKDREGRVVLQQATDTIGVINTAPYTLGGILNKTYYIYDAMGKLRYILPPAVADAAYNNGSISQTVLDQFCFQYRYDEKGRKVEQKVPGKGWEYFVYDKRGRLLLYQDSSLRTSYKWTITLYDPLDRPTMTGILGTSANRQQLVTVINDTTVFQSNSYFYYAKRYDLWRAYPSALVGCDILSYTYYDDYKDADPNGDLWNTWASYKLQSGELQYPNSGAETPQRTLKNLNAPTGGKVKVLASPGSSNIAAWRRTALFYDDKGKLIYSASQDLDGNNNVIHASYSSSQYGFSGQVLAGKQVLVNNKSTDGYTQHTELNKNEYEATTGLLGKTWRKVDNAASWLLTGSYTYDD
ncbi:DUF6443 domain-containing protein, partial [Taibaiella helva]|uniref:DUF6443 domain-containing protein n=1 Tax=Taibaiella helva TaxID=2301235 RepID=UPI0018E53F08